LRNLRAVVLLILGLWIALPCSAQWSGERGSRGRDQGYERDERSFGRDYGLPERSPRGAAKNGGGAAEKGPGWDMGSSKSDGGGPVPSQESDSSRRGSAPAPASQSNRNSRSGDKPAPAAKTGSAKSPPSSPESSGRPERKLLDLKANKKS
jgi:hypothetical protein